MTSPVDTSVKFFYSDMSAAPVLNGVPGALLSVLDACGKDGFDTKALLSLVVSGGVATATWSGSHSAVADSVVLISGVTGPLTALNGEQKVVSKPNATSLTFATEAADGTASGSITIKMAPLGLLKPFTGTNKAVYKFSDPASAGMCLRVDDANAQFARVVGYESMSDVDTGIGPFPTPAQMAGGGYWPKSGAASTTAIPWLIIGDSRAFYIFTAPFVTSNSLARSGWVRGFGDMLALKPGGDAFACALNYSSNENVGSMSDGVFGGAGTTLFMRTAFPRSYTGVGSAALHSNVSYTRYDGTQMSGADGVLGPFPSPVDGSLRLVRMYLTAEPTTNGIPRAEVPGLYYVPQSGVFDTFKHLDKVDGTGVLAGRKLFDIQVSNSGAGSAPSNGNTGALFVDCTGPWR